MATQLSSQAYRTTPLWQGLAAMRIEASGAALTFPQRLARDSGWRRPFADRVMEEYRRFLYLATTGPGQVTPSVAVDEAWHLHLTYTRHYWEELCGRILGAPLHHNPTDGGPAERQRYFDQYAATLERYEQVFGAAPPADIWPDPVTRFSPPRRPLPARLGFAAGASMLLAACTALAGNSSGGGAAATDENGWIIPVFVGVIVFVTLASLIFGAKLVKRRADGSCGSFFSADSSDGSGDGGDGCGGGCGGGS